jgi:hypothetical protein
MSNGVISLLEMLLPYRNLLKSESNDELSKAVLSIIAPTTARDAYGRFKKLQCMNKGNNISVEVVLKFISDWNEELRWSESILPGDGKLKALFLSQLKPDGLSANVAFNEPNSLSEAMKMAVAEAMSLADMFRKTQEAGLIPTGDRRGGAIQCFTCGAEGHKKEKFQLNS